MAYLLAEALVLALQLLAVKLALLLGQGALPQLLDGALQTLVLLLELQQTAGRRLVQLEHKRLARCGRREERKGFNLGSKVKFGWVKA